MHEETSRSENLLGSLGICVSSKFYLKKKKKHLSHTGEKPYSYDLCTSAFTSSYVWKHTREKPYSCGSLCHVLTNKSNSIELVEKIDRQESEMKWDRSFGQT